MKFWKNSIIKKIITASLAAALILAPMSVSATTIDEIKQKQADLQAETDALQDKLNSLKDDEAQAQAYSDALQEKISLTEEKIDNAQKNIDTLNSSIKELEQKLKDSEKEYDSTMEQFKERIKALYMTGDVGTIEILLNSTSLYDFSLKNETLKSVTAHDGELMEQIKTYMEETEADRNDLQTQKEELAETKKQLEADQSELQGLEEENQQVIATLQSAQSETESAISENESEDEAYNAQISDLIAQAQAAEEQRRQEQLAAQQAAQEEAAQQGDGSDGSGENLIDSSENTTTSDDVVMSDGFYPIWPLPGYGTGAITCYYGDGGHMGLDLGAPYGTPIVAAQDGQVLSAEYHWSWGNNVLIYHNGTYQTRYAHMSSMAVSAGQYVTAGQTIGYVGSTGNSTGNHLHFEVYQNGYRVNPLGFIG